MQKIAFTLCSNNYLAHAKTLGDSLRLTNPDIHFIIGLTDRLSPEIDYSFFTPFEILEYDKIGISFFEGMVVKYNIIEFNTSVKPFYFSYLFNRFGNDALVYYLDPDLAIYSSFDDMHRRLAEYNFVVTPHILTPRITMTPHEAVFLNVGIYNLGFIGMRYSENTRLFLEWWQYRMKDYCYIDLANGLFVDQIWVNFLHILFEKAHILSSPGYNMAYWNFYERALLTRDNKWFVNNTDTSLVFFHFSGFNPLNAGTFTRDTKAEFNTTTRPDLTLLFKEYAGQLIANKYEKLSKITPLLNFKPRKPTYSRWQLLGKSIKLRTDRFVKKIFNV